MVIKNIRASCRRQGDQLCAPPHLVTAKCGTCMAGTLPGTLPGTPIAESSEFFAQATRLLQQDAPAAASSQRAHGWGLAALNPWPPLPPSLYGKGKGGGESSAGKGKGGSALFAGKGKGGGGPLAGKGKGGGGPLAGKGKGASSAAPVELALVGELPAHAAAKVKIHHKAALDTLLFVRREEVVNGRPSYLQVNKAGHADELMLWYSNSAWLIGRPGRKGTPSGWFTLGDVDEGTEPGLVQGTWSVIADPEDGGPAAVWVDAPRLQLFCKPSLGKPAQAWLAPDVAMVGMLTREQRDEEARKHAIDLELTGRARKRSRIYLELEARIDKARSKAAAEVHERYLVLMKPAFAAYCADKIDEAELGRRKKEARAKAVAEHGPLEKLNKTVDMLTEARSACDAAESEHNKVQALLETALVGMEPVAFPSSTSKREQPSEPPV